MLVRLLDPAVLGTLIPIVAIVIAGAVVVMRVWFRHRERMAMIEAGLHPDLREAEAEDEDDPRRLEAGTRERTLLESSSPRSSPRAPSRPNER